MLMLTVSKYGLKGVNWSDQVRICKTEDSVQPGWYQHRVSESYISKHLAHHRPRTTNVINDSFSPSITASSGKTRDRTTKFLSVRYRI
jgi:hypothetical protein